MNDRQHTIWPAAQEAVQREKTGPEAGIYPHAYTTGWLVCVSGPEKGRDYRLGFGRNAIGRDYGRDVLIFEDQQISREAHAYVIYDGKTAKFYLAPGMGTAVFLIREGGKHMVTEAVPLADGERILIGETELVFVAFCRPDRNWNN